MAWRTNICRITVFLTVSWFTITYGIFITVPRNTVAKLGDRVEFECSTNEDESSPFDWTFTSTTSSQKENIYQNGYTNNNFTSKYAINNTTRGRFNLNMNSVDLSFAGKYTCSEPEFAGEDKPRSVAAHLIVIESDPVCSSNASKVIMEDNYIRLCCTVNYTGNWIPVMEWTISNGQTVDDNVNYTYTSTTVTSTLTIQLNSSDYGITFTCKTTFKATSTKISRTIIPSETLETNVPDYQYVWSVKANVSSDSSKNNVPYAIIGINVVAMILITVITTIICKVRKRRKTKPDIVPKVEQNNHDASDLSRSQPNPSLFAEVQNNSNGFQLAVNHPMPVNASVKKESIGPKQTVGNNHQPNRSIPVYAEVKKMGKEEKLPGLSGQISLPTETKPKQNYTGADGTQYEEMNTFNDQKSNVVHVKHPPLFSLVETYASIDHTMAAPPPPPPLPRRH